MKIIVSIKRVPDPYAKIRFQSDQKSLNLEGIKWEINPFDEIAMEAATQIKESASQFGITSNIEIIAVSIGTDVCEEQLRKALAMGADRAILVQTNDELDSGQIADELLEIVKNENPNMVLMGKQATDDDCNQAGQMLAAKLKWPQATFASKITIAGEKLTVTRETDLGDETISMPLPAVVTSDLRLATPRYIALPGIIKARSKPLEKRPRHGTETSRIKTIEVSPPPARVAGKRVSSVDELKNELIARGAI